MAVYFIVSGTITDQERLDRYLAESGSTLAGRDVAVRVFTTEAQVIEGTPPGRRVVMLEFADEAGFREWYASPGYQAILPDRLAGTEGFALLVEGRPVA